MIKMQKIPTGLTEQILNKYALNFFGFGKWEAPIWLIGLEEWGATAENEFEKRFVAWNKSQSCNSLLDLREYACECKIELKWKNPTWRAMHTICCEAGYTIGELCPFNSNWGGSGCGNLDSAVALIEAMPFPSPSTKKWPYTTWEQFGIQTREACAEKYLDQRLQSIVENLGKKYRPKLIVLYGRSYAKKDDVLQKWIAQTSIYLKIPPANWVKDTVPWTRKSRSHYHLNQMSWPNGELSILACVSQPSSYRRGGKDVPKKLGEMIRSNLKK